MGREIDGLDRPGSPGLSYERMNDPGGTDGSSGGAPAPSPTRDALLEAARRLFARRGYDGASVRAITTKAGANLGAVTYHFGSKRALYDEVLASVLEPLRVRVGEAAETTGTSLDRIGAVVRAFFAHLGMNPDLPQLLLQEIAAGKDPPAPVARTLGGVMGHLRAIVTQGQAAGEIRDGDPVLLAFGCIAQPVHLTLVRRWASQLAGVEMDAPDGRERVVQHAVAFARAGLEARRASDAAERSSGAADFPEAGDAT